ncbi:MAG: GPR endopeptidase [Firmicutes bacterium]|nr:GPR endopeptidase [Bacillota bacterium]
MFKNSRTDLAIEKDILDNSYELIVFNDLLDKVKIKKEIMKKIKHFIKIKNNKHIFIVGLGNENNTADSIGPNVIKKINVNSHLNDFGVKTKNKISALEPGVLGTTGINTKKIVESITKEIKPDLVIVIDSYITKDFKYLNKSIQITNKGITPGSGFSSKDDEISYNTLHIPVLVIGVATAIEIKKYSKNYIVSTKDIDKYVIDISNIISDALNTIFG